MIEMYDMRDTCQPHPEVVDQNAPSVHIISVGVGGVGVGMGISVGIRDYVNAWRILSFIAFYHLFWVCMYVYHSFMCVYVCMYI